MRGCNKVLELIGNGKNLTLRNVECLALAKDDGTQNSGSIYINVADAGNTVLENVTLYSWINAHYCYNRYRNRKQCGTRLYQQ